MRKFFSEKKFHILVFVFSFLMFAKFNIDPDLGWHLAMGNKFLDEGEIVLADQFSWTMNGYEWGNYFFLYQILVAFLFKTIGYIGTVLVFGVIGSAAILILLPKKMNIWKFLIVGVGVSVATINLAVRPSMISLFMFALLLIFLKRRIFEKKPYIILWFVFFALWANFHQGFLAGIAVLATFVFFDNLHLKVLKKAINLKIEVVSISAAILGTLLTPYGLEVWKSIVYDLTGSKTWIISEWQPIVVHFPSNILWAASCLIFIYIFYKKIREIEPVWVIIASFIFIFSFIATNSSLFWAVIFIYLAARLFDFNLDLKQDFLSKFVLGYIFASIMLAFMAGFIVNYLESNTLKKRLIKDGYPSEAIEYLRDHQLNTGLFNTYGWGGYLIWKYPQAKVFIDGRMTGWRGNDGTYILSDYISILSGKCEVLEKYDVKTLLISKDTNVKCFENFKVVYEDTFAKVMIKK